VVAHAVPVEACPAIQPYRWTRAEFDKLGLADIFHPDARVELIDGEILAMAPLCPLDATAIQLVQTLLRDHCGNGFMVSTQLPLAISDDSQPVPDVMVSVGQPRDYREHHPTTAVLVVEISFSTLDFDRNCKLRLYARNGIPEYWLLNLLDLQLEVHRHPQRDSYNTKQTFSAMDVVSPLSLPAAAISVADLLP
jgi:Uma2 family endonuclease